MAKTSCLHAWFFLTIGLLVGCSADQDNSDSRRRRDAGRDASMDAGIVDGAIGRDVGSEAGEDVPRAKDAQDGPSTTMEICDNGFDDNGDGQADEMCPCRPGSTQRCFPGPRGTEGVGVCRFGMQQCMGTSGGEFGTWGPCEGAIVPTRDVCDGVDNDCNGTVDDGCLCIPGTTQRCYDGPVGTEGRGICRAGTQTCMMRGTDAAWGPCTGQVLPISEVCTDRLDNDCDGLADCSDIDCSSRAVPEVCNDWVDNDCDGLIDCADSDCRSRPEVCNDGADNDCDGLVDCADPDCRTDRACRPDCSTGGSWMFVDHWYGCLPGGLCSSRNSARGACGIWNAGGQFSARCAGTYQVCLRVVATSGCSFGERCVTVTVPTDGATVSLPPFPEFSDTGPCAMEAGWGGTGRGGRTCVRVTGTTTYGETVNREAGCFAEFCACNATGCGGTSGGSGSGSW